MTQLPIKTHVHSHSAAVKPITHNNVFSVKTASLSLRHTVRCKMEKRKHREETPGCISEILPAQKDRRESRCVLVIFYLD